jgi:hypothetical protein
MASTGGDTFGTINPVFSWFLLIAEISISGIAVMSGVISILLSNIMKGRKTQLIKIVLITGIAAYIIHLIRVAIWLICIS